MTGYKQTEIGTIPEDWEVVNIGDVCQVIGGGTPSTLIKEYWSGDIRWFTPTEVGKTKYLYDSLRKITELGLKNSSATILPINTILMTSRAGIGDLGILKNESSTNQGFQSLVCKNINVEFTYYLIQTKKTELLNNSSGSTFLEISPNKVKSIQIPLPPLPEQEAIAAALSDADAWVESLEQLIEKKRLLKQAAMQKLLSPKEDWEVKKLGEVIDVYRGGSPRPIQDYITVKSDGINWIKIGDTSSTGKYIVNANEKIIPDGMKYSRSVFVGDFLLSNSMSFGRPYILKIEGCIHDGWLVLQNYHQFFHTEFLYYLLTSKYIIDQYKSKAAGSSVLNLNKELVSSVDLLIPSHSEQTRIATILSDMDAEIEALENQLAKARQIKQGMMQELLTGRIRLV